MKKLIIKYFNMLIVPVILVIIWQCLSNAGLIYDVILPSPIKCWYAFVEIVKNGSLKVDLLVSLKRVLFGC